MLFHNIFKFSTSLSKLSLMSFAISMYCMQLFPYSALLILFSQLLLAENHYLISLLRILYSQLQGISNETVQGADGCNLALMVTP